MELDKIKQKATKLQIRNTKYNCYSIKSHTFRQDMLYVFDKSDTSDFEELIELSVYSPYIDCEVFDVANELFYTHKNVKDSSTSTEVQNVVTAPKDVKPVIIEFDKDNDLFDNIIQDRFDYRVDKDVDVAIAKSKLTDVEIQNIQSQFKAITPVSKKADIIELIAKIDGRAEDEIAENKNKTKLYQELSALVQSLVKG